MWLLLLFIIPCLGNISFYKYQNSSDFYISLEFNYTNHQKLEKCNLKRITSPDISKKIVKDGNFIMCFGKYFIGKYYLDNIDVKIPSKLQNCYTNLLTNDICSYSHLSFYLIFGIILLIILSVILFKTCIHHVSCSRFKPTNELVLF